MKKKKRTNAGNFPVTDVIVRDNFEPREVSNHCKQTVVFIRDNVKIGTVRTFHRHADSLLTFF